MVGLQGMCFTLPTPEDPFNEKQGKVEPMKKRKKNSKANKNLMNQRTPRLKTGSSENDDDAGEHLHEEDITESKTLENGKSASVSSVSFMGPEIASNLGKPTRHIIRSDGSKDSWKELGLEKIVECPSKFLVMCMNFIQNGVAISSEGDKPLIANTWGLEFFNCYCTDKDVLETNAADSKLEQIAWIASTAADAVSMKKKESISHTDPFLLYLVPSQDKASRVCGNFSNVSISFIICYYFSNSLQLDSGCYVFFFYLHELCRA